MAEKHGVCALICEYNPLHFGHLYQLTKLKERFASVVCILGGNISQRGEVAVCDRYTRARAAVAAGADLVVELPVPWCCASAREFARGGVYLAKALGTDCLAFSAESDAALLYGAAEKREKAEQDILALMKTRGNLSYPAAAEQILGKTLSGMPNDILAIEYIAAAKAFPTYILKREKSFLSSTAIRNSGDPLPHLPVQVREIFSADPSFPRKTETVGTYLLAVLRNDPREAVYGMTPELFARIKQTAEDADTFDEFLRRTANKVFTVSRVRRAAWSAAFGFPQDLRELLPAHTVLLAANENGRAFLRRTAKTRTVSVLSRPAQQGETVGMRVNDVLRVFYGGEREHNRRPFL